MELTGRMQGLWERFVAIGKQGANADVNHPLRKQWEDLRAELQYLGAQNLGRSES
jgi:hypothetical protein